MFWGHSYTLFGWTSALHHGHDSTRRPTEREEITGLAAGEGKKSEIWGVRLRVVRQKREVRRNRVHFHTKPLHPNDIFIQFLIGFIQSHTSRNTASPQNSFIQKQLHPKTVSSNDRPVQITVMNDKQGQKVWGDQKGGGPTIQKVGAPKVWGPKGGSPEGWRAKISRFFPSPASFSLIVFSLKRSSRRIVAKGREPPKLCVGASPVQREDTQESFYLSCFFSFVSFHFFLFFFW